MISENAITRRGLLGGLAGLGILAAAPAFASAPAVLKGAGNYRKISLTSHKTGEWLNTVYWIEGEYIPEAMDAISHLMRDWREDVVKPIDPRTIDIMSATQHLLECGEPFTVVSGYRTKRTNAMLRDRSRGVAKNSYHLKGMAVDLACRSRSVRQVAAAAQSLGAGGVGRYSRSEFTHVDSGPVRQWGR